MSTAIGEIVEDPKMVNDGGVPRMVEVHQFCGPKDINKSRARKCIQLTISDGEYTVGRSSYIRLSESQALELCRVIANAYLGAHKQIPENVGFSA